MNFKEKENISRKRVEMLDICVCVRVKKIYFSTPTNNL